ncbi:unnamed protein product [marine sediment metagenome]|uniref:Uncharacterized protein n=1 Tax=marine sediment metagenome TaxID=412755 RepID=X1REQ5_9ZZZZ
MSAKLLDLRRLKRFAREKLSTHPILRDLILMEPDKVDAREYLGKLPIWVELLELEGGDRK